VTEHGAAGVDLDMSLGLDRSKVIDRSVSRQLHVLDGQIVADSAARSMEGV
jgi:hypothetical protein